MFIRDLLIIMLINRIVGYGAHVIKLLYWIDTLMRFPNWHVLFLQ